LWNEGAFHGKGLYYKSATNKWQLGKFVNGNMKEKISSGEGRPSSLGSYLAYIYSYKVEV